MHYSVMWTVILFLFVASVASVGMAILSSPLPCAPQTDFSGRVVNNEHFMYWGEVSKVSEEGIPFQFSVVEQTEFIDDASFQPFKGEKGRPAVSHEFRIQRLRGRVVKPRCQMCRN